MSPQPTSVGPKVIEVPDHLSRATIPKTVDFTSIDMYPSKYKILNGRVYVKSFILEDVRRQEAALIALNTTVLIGDYIQVDLKFGHLQSGEWVDYYVKGRYRVKQITPMRGTNEILFLVTEV